MCCLAIQCAKVFQVSSQVKPGYVSGPLSEGAGDSPLVLLIYCSIYCHTLMPKYLTFDFLEQTLEEINQPGQLFKMNEGGKYLYIQYMYVGAKHQPPDET